MSLSEPVLRYSRCCPTLSAQDSLAGQPAINRDPGQLMKTLSQTSESFI